MKKSLRAIIITIIAIMVMAIAAITVNADSGEIVSVKLSSSSVTMNAGQSKGLGVSASAYGMTSSEIQSEIRNEAEWTSSNNSVATVNNGTVKAKKAGTTTITVDVDGNEATCVIIVNNVKPTVQNTNAAYNQLNNYRKAYNKSKKLKGKKALKTLKRDAALEKIALQRAKEMAETGKFSHTRPNGKSGLTLIKGRKAKGENIAMGQKTCDQVSRAWYNSAGHRKNMLRKNFTKVGIAGYTLNGVTYWAQVFSN